MGRGRSKAGGSGRLMSHKTFMSLDDEAKDEMILRALELTQVPEGIKDTPTMRVMIAFGMDKPPKVVADNELDSMAGTELFRTVTDEKSGKTSDEIVRELMTGKHTSLSDTNGSSEGRGIYFAKDLDSSAFWGTDGGRVDKSNKIMRAKISNSAKVLDIDEVLYGGKVRSEYVGDRHFQSMVQKRKIPVWDAISIWALKKGYKAGKATDTGTGDSEMIVFDRGVLSMSKTVKSIKPGYKKGKGISWKSL